MSRIRLHVLFCGHGDTLLLEMPKGKWGLIDCHLPGKAARKRFFRYVESLGITTLDYVVLTHPDSDHYRGMRHVLRYFCRNGRKLGLFCAAGASPAHVAKLIEARGAAPDDVTEYVKLVRTVLELQQAGLLRRHALHDQTATVRISGKRRGFALVAVAPAYDDLARAGDLALLGELGGLSVNQCSVVLVVQFITTFTSRQIFLAGDMERDGMSKALQRWDTHPDNVGRVRTFDGVKAPHHGSINGHDPGLADRIARVRSSSILISCGTSYDLPSRAVVRDYLDRDWRVYCTSPRRVTGRRKNALQATQRRASLNPPTEGETYNLIVTATGFGRFWVSPKAARIERSQLNAYS